MILRGYQTTIVDQIRDVFRRGTQRQVLVSPTGSGKTSIFSFITHGCLAKGTQTLILTHRKEIMRQIQLALKSWGVPHGTIEAGKPIDRHQPVHIASVQTLVRRFSEVPTPGFIVGDEIHHCVSATWVKVLAQYNKARVLGVTATPERLDGRGLGEFFTEMVMGPSVQWLVDNHWLAKPVYYAPPPEQQIDFSGLRKTAGEFNHKDAAAMLDVPSITGSAVEHYKRLCDGKKAIVFCHSVEHAEHVARQFCAAGIAANSIDWQMTDAGRAARMQDLETGRVPVLTSCELISEGIDVAAVNCAILLRVTASLALHLQQIGRALRPKPDGSPAIILDHVSNVIRHGLAEEEREWSLEGHAKKKRSKDPLVECRQCASCYAIFSGRECPQCGAERDVQGREIVERAGNLVLMTKEEIAVLRGKRDTRVEEGMCKTLADWQKLGRARGYKPGWSFMRWSARLKKGVTVHANPDDARPTLKTPELAL